MRRYWLKYYLLFILSIIGWSVNASVQLNEKITEVNVELEYLSTDKDQALYNLPNSENDEQLFWEETFEEEDDETDSDEFQIVNQYFNTVCFAISDSLFDDHYVRNVLPFLKNEPSLQRSIRIYIQVFRI